MSKYTTSFYELIQMGLYSKSEIANWFKDYELSDYLTVDEIQVINAHGTWSKEKLAEKIIDHYYFKEFGVESPAMFRHYAKIQMKEIMESKLPLIYSAAIKYDPLVNVDFTETYTSNTTGNSSSSGLTVNSDTPQGQINKAAILNGSYASSTGASEDTAGSSGTMNYTRNTKGNSGVSATAQAMVKQYRENIRAIDYEIIEELKDLFIGLL
jgi:hypothetical protein